VSVLISSSMMKRRSPPFLHRQLYPTIALLTALFFVGLSPASGAKPAAKSTTSAKTPAKTSTKTLKAKAPKVTLGMVRRTQLQRDQIRAQKAKSAATVNALKSSKSKVAASLASLNSNVRLTSVALDKAQRSAKRAQSELVSAESRLRDLETQLAQLREGQVRAALDAFSAPGGGEFDAVVNANDASEAGRRQALAAIARRSQADLVDQLNALQEDMTIERAIAAKARKRAESIQAAVSSKLSDYQSARTDQQKYAESVEARLERELEESASLSGLDFKLSQQLIAQNDLLTRQLASAGAGARGSGKFSAFINNPTTAVGGDTHGITVAASIRGRLASMLAAAQRNGVFLTGGGYRSSASQIALRRAHCGSSTFSIYQQRSSSCRPPTARPGNSMHERGLAIDFVDRGGALRRGSAGYQWLRQHAEAYGFFNLPSEPWHWSVNGR
jgi:D-alanyl-D-alanine carboxypeptidase